MAGGRSPGAPGRGDTRAPELPLTVEPSTPPAPPGAGATAAWRWCGALVAVALVAAACSSSPTSAKKKTTTTTTSEPAAPKTATTCSSTGGALSATCDTQSPSFKLAGAGANSIQPFFTRVFYYYSQANKGVSVNYSPAGSSVGVTDIEQNTVNFGDSEIPIKTPATGTGGAIVQVPVDLGGVALSYNLPGVSGGLKLDGPTLAGIYLGTITKWNDAAIAALNPGVSLPSTTIVPVHRADSSGPGYDLDQYLIDTGGSAWTGSAAGTTPSTKWPMHQDRRGRATQHRGGGLHPADPGCHRVRRVRVHAPGELHQRRPQERVGELREAEPVEHRRRGRTGLGTERVQLRHRQRARGGHLPARQLQLDALLPEAVQRHPRGRAGQAAGLGHDHGAAAGGRARVLAATRQRGRGWPMPRC